MIDIGDLTCEHLMFTPKCPTMAMSPQKAKTTLRIFEKQNWETAKQVALEKTSTSKIIL